MILTDDLPPEYVPFERLNLCGNTLINCRVPVRMKGHAPFLVGKGPGTSLWVWLSMPSSKEFNSWLPLVERNVSKNRRIVAQLAGEDGVVVTTIVDPLLPVLAAKRDSEVEATVHTLDLRHVGLRVYGDQQSGLVLATNKIIGNVFENIETILSV